MVDADRRVRRYRLEESLSYGRNKSQAFRIGGLFYEPIPAFYVVSKLDRSNITASFIYCCLCKTKPSTSAELPASITKTGPVSSKLTLTSA